MTFKEHIIEKQKLMSGYDYYKSVRKSTPPTGTSFKDKKKYNRKDKHKKGLEESLQSSDIYKQVSQTLASFGMKAFEQEPVLKIVQKAITLAFNEGYKAGTNNPFKTL